MVFSILPAGRIWWLVLALLIGGLVWAADRVRLPYGRSMVGAILAVEVAPEPGFVSALWVAGILPAIWQAQNVLCLLRTSGKSLRRRPASPVVRPLVGKQLAGLRETLVAVPVAQVIPGRINFLYVRFLPDHPGPEGATARIRSGQELQLGV